MAIFWYLKMILFWTQNGTPQMTHQILRRMTAPIIPQWHRYLDLCVSVQSHCMVDIYRTSLSGTLPDDGQHTDYEYYQSLLLVHHHQCYGPRC